MGKEIQKVQDQMYTMIAGNSSKIQLIEAFGHLNLKTIVQEQYPSILKLKTYYGNEKVDQAIQVIVKDMNTAFGNDLTNQDIQEISAEIRADRMLRSLKLEGIYLVCSELKRSNIYGKLTVNKVMNALKSHLNEYVNACQSNSYNNHLAMKETPVNKYDFAQKEKAYESFKELEEAKQIVKNQSDQKPSK